MIPTTILMIAFSYIQVKVFPVFCVNIPGKRICLATIRADITAGFSVVWFQYIFIIIHFYYSNRTVSYQSYFRTKYEEYESKLLYLYLFMLFMPEYFIHIKLFMNIHKLLYFVVYQYYSVNIQ
jgi:hypothetical protein